uniref:G_PROTEIN_RECEP_F1_2 domain-containing protein n=1 Tax=Caenorhabditis tropicalis TaxID=1561998 RepID=A0A1I7UDS7_9PELO
MYLFLTTPFPRPSTERWFGFEVGDYYYYDGGPEAYWDQKPDYIFDDKTKDEIIEQSDIADLVVSFIGLFLNFLHLLILTRKELRANVVFIIILGISICDILICIGSITERYFKDSHFIARYEGFCGTDYQWWMVFIEAFSQGIQKFGRLTEALFALSTAAIRAVTVLFPMSSMADRLMKLTSGIIILVFNSVLCGVLYSIYYSMIEIYREGNSDL